MEQEHSEIKILVYLFCVANLFASDIKMTFFTSWQSIYKKTCMLYCSFCSEQKTKIYSLYFVATFIITLKESSWPELSRFQSNAISVDYGQSRINWGRWCCPGFEIWMLLVQNPRYFAMAQWFGFQYMKSGDPWFEILHQVNIILDLSSEGLSSSPLPHYVNCQLVRLTPVRFLILFNFLYTHTCVFICLQIWQLVVQD